MTFVKDVTNELRQMAAVGEISPLLCDRAIRLVEADDDFSEQSPLSVGEAASLAVALAGAP